MKGGEVIGATGEVIGAPTLLFLFLHQIEQVPYCVNALRRIDTNNNDATIIGTRNPAAHVNTRRRSRRANSYDAAIGSCSWHKVT